MAAQIPRTRRWVLIGGGAAVAAGFAIREYRLIPQAHAGQRITVAQAHDQARHGEILLVDIRTPNEWRASGVGEGAVPLDMRREDFVSALGDLVDGDQGAAIALICARGVRSARLTNRLIEAGFTNIIDVPEGMLGSAAGPGWVRAGLPVLDFDEDTG